MNRRKALISIPCAAIAAPVLTGCETTDNTLSVDGNPYDPEINGIALPGGITLGAGDSIGLLIADQWYRLQPGLQMEIATKSGGSPDHHIITFTEVTKIAGPEEL